jgi:hypothetical protein
MLTVQQEILLFTNNSFSQQLLCEKQITEGSKQLSQMEQLEAACWNGLLGELLPEIVEQPGNADKFFLWEIRQGEASLHIQLSESSVHLDMQDSIDPYLFMANQLLNN